MAQDTPPNSLEDVRQRDWPDTAKQAWRVLHEARPGDLVLFADRAKALEVTDQWTDNKGLAHLTVAGPKGGEYQVNERYGAHGEPKFSSDIGRATDLQWVERQPLPRGLTESEFRSLVETLADRSVDSYTRLDYSKFWDAAEDVVDDWVESVSFHDWAGYDREEWQEDDPDAIFRSVTEHADRLPDVGTPHQDVEQTPKNQAKLVLTEEVYEAGKRDAEAELVHSASTYNDLVNDLGQRAIERYERKSYPSARQAVQDTVSDFTDSHTDITYTSILEHAPRPVESTALYDDLPAEERARERAFDTLDRDVWDTVAAIQRSRNEHDPTERGLTRRQYDDLVEALTEETLRRHGTNQLGFIRTTANDVIDEWADEVENREWDGHRHRVWGAGDPDDIFASTVMHSNSDPITLNPFAANAERKMAEQVILSDVTERADRAMDENDVESEPIPADEYLADELGINMTYAELQDEDIESVEEFLQNVLEGLEGDEMGWTFVDELVAAGGRVPHLTNEWVLVDYGIVREGQKPRRLAWFHRETGDVLVMTGAADAPPEEEGWSFGDFQVLRMRYLKDDGPQFLLTDASVGEALRFVYDYVDAERADMKIIESPNGDRWIIDAIEETDINTGGVLDALVPNFSVPGPDLTEADLFTASVGRLRGMAKHTRKWSMEIKAMAAFGVLSLLPYRASKFLTNVRVEPNIHKKHGVGLNFSYEYGADSDEEGVGGKIEGDVNIRKATLAKFGSAATPDFLKELGGTRTVQTVREGVDAKERFQRRFRRIAYPISMSMLKPSDNEYTQDHENYEQLTSNLPDESEYKRLLTKAGQNDIGWNDFLRLRAYMYENDIHPDDAYPRADYWNNFWEKLDETPEWSWTREALSAFDYLNRNTDDPVEAIPGYASLREGVAARRTDEFNRAVAEATGESIEEVGDWSNSRIRREVGTSEYRRIQEETGFDIRETQRRLAEETDALDVTGQDAIDMDPEEFRQRVEDAERELGEELYDDLREDAGEMSADDVSWSDVEGEGVPLGNIFLRGLNVQTVLKEGSKRIPVNDWSLFGSSFIQSPEEPPSFEEWRQNRYGPEMNAGPSFEEQRARYKREIDTAEAPDPHEVMGTSAVADEQALGEMHDAPDDQGDYYQGDYYASEYASDYGMADSFDDVAKRFGSTQPGTPPMKDE